MANQKAQSKQDTPTAGRDFPPMPSNEQSGKGAMGDHGADTSLMEQAKSTAGDAYHAVADKATATFEDRKAGVTGGLTSVADTIRLAGDSLRENQEQNYLTEYSARYANTAAEKLEQTARYFENNDLKSMARDVQDFARRNPAMFLGGAFALGILAARLLKSSPPSAHAAGQSIQQADHQLTQGASDRQEWNAQAQGM